MIKDKHILLISPEPWGKSKVSKHHYAEHLAAMGNEVYFLAPERTDQEDLPRGIHLLEPPKAPRGLRFYPPFWRKRAHRKIGRKLLRSCGSGACFDILWSFDTSWMFDLKEIAPEAFRILHLVDLSMDFQWKEAAAQAELCLGSSHRLRDKLKKANPNSYFLHHGYTKYPGLPNVLSGDRKKVVYAGNLTIEYLDRERLTKLVSAYPDVEFHFIGDQGEGNLSAGRTSTFLSELEAKENVSLHPAVHPELLASYYQAADALLVCYSPEFREQISNPHKVMEYLGSGKPILSTFLEEYQEQQDLIFMSDEEGAYVEALEGLLNEDDTEKRERRRAFANAHTYLKQIEKVKQLMKKSLNA